MEPQYVVSLLQIKTIKKLCWTGAQALNPSISNTDNIFLISNNTTITLNYNYFQLQLQASNLSFKGFKEIAADA